MSYEQIPLTLYLQKSICMSDLGLVTADIFVSQFAHNFEWGKGGNLHSAISP